MVILVVIAAAAASVVVVAVLAMIVPRRAGSAVALAVVVMQAKSRLLATGVQQIAVVLLATATTVARLFRAVLHRRATTMRTVLVLTTAARAVMTVPPVTAAVLHNVTTAAASATSAAVQKVFRLHPVVTLQTASPRLPGQPARCLCRATRRSVPRVLHVDRYLKYKKGPHCGPFFMGQTMPSAHAVAAGQLDKQARVVQVAQAVFRTLGIKLLEQGGDRRIKADLLCRRQRIAHVFELN